LEVEAMFEPTSRYSARKTATYTTFDGSEVPYVRRRFLPQGDNMPLLVEVTVTDGDRLDLITARTLGDPEQFWRICDANNAMNPFDLTAEPGAILRVPIPQVEV
jgi:nucleoid-associated protein YgaU